MKIWFALIPVALLAGCVAAQEKLNVAQDRTCQEWGFKPGTPGYGNCRLELSRQAASAAAVAALQPDPYQVYLEHRSALLTEQMNRRQTCNYSGLTIGGITSAGMTCQ
jgi:hypothetical protein